MSKRTKRGASWRARRSRLLARKSAFSKRKNAGRQPQARQQNLAQSGLAGRLLDALQRAAATGPRRLAVGPFLDFGRIYDGVTHPGLSEFRRSIRRPDDLLIFDVLFENLRLSGDLPPSLKKKNASAPAYLIVEFPAQNFGEEAFFEASSADDPNAHIDLEPVPPLPSSRVRMAGRSRLALSMPANETALPYTLGGVLLALRTWPMRLATSAAPDPDPLIFDRDWLRAIVDSESWAGTRESLSSAVASFARGIEQAVGRSARKLSRRAVGGLGADTDEDLGAVLRVMMRDEVERLAESFPQLRETNLREASITLMALRATEELGRDRARFVVDNDKLGLLPFIPIWFGPHEPSRTVTALELPYRVILSPLSPARWLHRQHPVEHQGRTELWHTRLTTGPQDTGRETPSKVRAIWSPDYPIDEFTPLLTPKPLPFRMSLDPFDRKRLVQLMAGFGELQPDGRSYTPRPSQAKRLHLSALGALLDVEGNWDRRPTGVDLEQWRHLAAIGRDHYVRVMEAGFLCPFGHAASLVKVTERKFQPLGGNANKRVAVLRQRYFILVREHIKKYSPGDHEFGGRNFPFTEIEILTRVTPDLWEPGKGDSAPKPAPGKPIYGGSGKNEIIPRMVFWPMLPTANPNHPADFRFDCSATDIDGNRITFSLPLLFVSATANRIRTDAIRAGYNAPGVIAKRRTGFGGATVCFAPFDPGDQGDPRLPTATMTFAAGNLRPGLKPVFAPRFYPETEGAEVGIRSVQKMLGLAHFVAPVAYPQVYKEAGSNPGQLFLQFTEVKGLDFGGGAGQAKSDALGALASPQMAVQGLSKIMGPVSAKPPVNPADPAAIAAGLTNIIQNRFDPTDFFRGAKILGGIDLADILTAVNSLVGNDVPKMLSREFVDRVEASFDWTAPVMQPDPLNLIIPRADLGKPQTQLVMKGLVTSPVANPAEANFEASASLDNFKVNLFGFIIIWFELLSFSAKKGQKSDVQVSLRSGQDAVQFGGPLEFVNTLREFIPSNGFSDPPSLSVTPSGISAGYSLTLPTIGVGIFSLSNASLGASFNLPFDSQPASVQFRFSEREHPFSLTVSLLGGGGFFAIGISSRGVNEIEAALEFGAAVSIDLGVASGSVEIKAGVYFHWLEPIPDKGSIDLAGYVRIHGELTVIAIISVSLTFNLQLGYHKEGGKSLMYGEATLVVEVEVLFFSADISVRCRREFQGPASDPKFIDLMPDKTLWSEYCEAFAAEAA